METPKPDATQEISLETVENDPIAIAERDSNFDRLHEFLSNLANSRSNVEPLQKIQQGKAPATNEPEQLDNSDGFRYFLHLDG